MSFALPAHADSEKGLNAGLMGVGAFLIAMMANTGSSGGLQVILYGLLLEAGRRMFTWLYARLLLRPRVSATFLEGDPSYEWILHYLTANGIWKTSRDFTVNTKSTKRRFAVNASLKKASNKRHVDLVPTWQAPHLFRWRGYWIDVSRATSDEVEYSSDHGYRSLQALKLQFFTLDAEVITRFVDETRELYETANVENVTIHSSINAEYRSATWRNAKSKTKRSLDSIALPEGVLSSILEDIREFIDIEDWYKDAGIPHHRGYLLYGPPGTGKTSSVYAIAGELGLEIYALSLADSHVDDAYLQDIAGAVPRNSILLIEDIDCAFPSREDEEDEENSSSPRRENRSKVTLSGILNLMDGVASDDGRIIIATTNYYERLDPALVRPGRIDVKVEYKKATSEQAAALFKRFFPPSRFSEISTADKSTSPEFSANRYARKTPLSRSLPELCQAFASALPKDEFTTAELQGYLLKCKWDPEQAVEKLGAWVEELRAEAKQRAEREEEAKKKRRRAKRKAAKKAAKEAAKAAASDISTPASSDAEGS